MQGIMCNLSCIVVLCALQRNLLDANNPEMKKLTDMMMRRDPFYKAPATPDPDADAEKTR